MINVKEEDEKSLKAIEALAESRRTLVLIILLLLVLLSGTICYLVFGIKYLVEDYKIANECKDSNLWAYVLVAMIMALPSVSIGGQKSEENLSLVYVAIINLGLSIWGGIELWSNSKNCDDLYNSNLWKVGLATFILQIFISTICFVLLPILICCMECNRSSLDEIENTDLENPFSKINIDLKNKENKKTPVISSV